MLLHEQSEVVLPTFSTNELDVWLDAVRRLCLRQLQVDSPQT